MKGNVGLLFYKHYYEDFFIGDQTTKSYWKTTEEVNKLYQRKERDKKEFEKNQKKYFDDKNNRIFNQCEVAPPDAFYTGSSNFELKTTSGLLIGIGYTHETGIAGEIKIGFFFDHTNGLPTIPGSSIKGLLRSVFPGFTHEEYAANFDKVILKNVLENKGISSTKIDEAMKEFDLKLENANYTNW